MCLVLPPLIPVARTGGSLASSATMVPGSHPTSATTTVAATPPAQSDNRNTPGESAGAEEGSNKLEACGQDRPTEEVTLLPGESAGAGTIVAELATPTVLVTVLWLVKPVFKVDTLLAMYR